MQAVRDTVAAMRRGEIRDLSGLNNENLVELEELQIDDVEPIRAELDAFLSAVVNRTRPEVSAEDGLAAVETAARIVEATKATG
jgi:predicted dehydrogenase